MAFVSPPIVPIAVIAHRRRILRKFEEAGASDAAHARTPAELDVRVGHIFERMVKSGVLVGASEGRYSVSAEGVARWQRSTRIAVLSVIGLAVVAVLVVVLALRGSGS